MMPTMVRESTQTLDPWFIDLYRSDYRPLVRLAGLLVDDRGLAEEIVQDAFVAAARSTQLRDPAKAPAYLRSIVLNGARSALRKRGVRRRHLASVPPPPTAPAADGDVDDRHDAGVVMAALRTLPTRQREVLVLRYWSELSEQEIADALGISTGSVKTHAHRGMQTLEARLEGLR